jgi:hypothetical protein
LPLIAFGQAKNKTYHSTDNPNIFKNSNGATIEYLGLQKWTAQQVQDSLKNLAPNRPVHACMVILKNKLGFQDANVIVHVKNLKAKNFYTVVTLVEPNGKGNSGNWKLPSTKKVVIKKWTAGYDISSLKIKRQILFGTQILQIKAGHLRLMPKIMKSFFIGKKQKEFMKDFFGYISTQTTKEDLNLAKQTLQKDGNIANRMLASLVLLNFTITKKDMYQMLKQMRSPSGLLNNFSAFVLRVMVQNKKKVDWSGAVKSIRAILNGTSVQEFTKVLIILTNTHISPRLANAVLKNDTFLVGQYLGAQYPGAKKTAMEFVEQISGKKFKNTANAMKWLSQFN